MKNKTYNIVMFLGFIFLGILIAFNYNFDGIKTSLDINAKEYKDAIDERSKLYKEITNLEKLNEEAINKINEYDKHGEDYIKIMEDIKMQLEDYGLLTGLSEVKGPGLEVVIKDGDVLPGDSEFTQWRKIFHDIDMEMVLNDFRLAGAQAITINKHRFLPTTGVSCNWAFIKVDESLEYAPFKFYIIGDPKVLKAALLDETSHLSSLILRDLKVEIVEKEEIILPATEMPVNVDSLKPYRKEK